MVLWKTPAWGIHSSSLLFALLEMSQRGVFMVVGSEVAGGYKGILPDILLELKDLACE